MSSKSDEKHGYRCKGSSSSEKNYFPDLRRTPAWSRGRLQYDLTKETRRNTPMRKRAQGRRTETRPAREQLPSTPGRGSIMVLRVCRCSCINSKRIYLFYKGQGTTRYCPEAAIYLRSRCRPAAIIFSLGEAVDAFAGPANTGSPQGPPRGGCIRGPQIGFGGNQQLANFKMTSNGRVH